MRRSSGAAAAEGGGLFLTPLPRCRYWRTIPHFHRCSNFVGVVIGVLACFCCWRVARRRRRHAEDSSTLRETGGQIGDCSKTESFPSTPYSHSVLVPGVMFVVVALVVVVLAAACCCCCRRCCCCWHVFCCCCHFPLLPPILSEKKDQL